MSVQLAPQDSDYVANNRRSGGTAADSRYQYREALDASGYGEVWLTYDNILNQTVVLKRLHQYLDDRPHIIDSLKREVDAGRRISSTNVVRIYDLVYVDRQYCVVMEYVKGPNLKALLSQQNWSPAALSQVILQMGAGLAAVHKAGFAHGDLNPENVLVEKDRVVIVDLGRATEIAGEDSSAAHSSSLTFMAPELFTVASSKGSDVYAFGQVVLYLLRGQPGYKQSEPFAVLPWLKPIIDKCVIADPTRRYQSAIEVFEELDGAPLRYLYDAQAKKRKQRLFIALFIIISLASIVLIVKTRHAARPEQQEVIQVVVSSSGENPLSRMLADLVGIYLETEHLAVSRPQYHFEPTSASVDKGVVPSIAIAVSLAVVDGKPSAHLRIDRPAANQHREVQIRSGHVIFESLSQIANELKSHQPRPVFDLAISENAELLRFAETWQTFNQSIVGFPRLKRESVLGLLLEARVNAHLFSVTGSTKNLRDAKAALDDLGKAGVVVSDTILLRSFLAQKEGESGLSVDILRAGLNTLTTTSAVHRSLADRQLAAGFANEAIVSGNNAIRLDPFSTDNYITAATAYSAVWQEQRAADLLTKASELDPSNGDIFLRLGIVYLRLGRFELARKALERNIELQPTVNATMYLGLSNLLCGNNAQALLLLKGVVAEHKSLRSLATLGAALRWVGQSALSRETLEEAKRFGNERSSDVSELGVLAMVNAQLGNRDKADALISRAGGSKVLVTPEILYDALVVDAFAMRHKACRQKYAALERRRFPIAFAKRDPQVVAALEDH